MVGHASPHVHHGLWVEAERFLDLGVSILPVDPHKKGRTL